MPQFEKVDDLTYTENTPKQGKLDDLINQRDAITTRIQALQAVKDSLVVKIQAIKATGVKGTK